jgi:hypothetical protein
MQAFEEASGRTVKYEIKPRRPGDAAAVWAATETAEQVLHPHTLIPSYPLIPSGKITQTPDAGGACGTTAHSMQMCSGPRPHSIAASRPAQSSAALWQLVSFGVTPLSVPAIRRCWAGQRSGTSRTCAATSGTGHPHTQTATAASEAGREPAGDSCSVDRNALDLAQYETMVNAQHAHLTATPRQQCVSFDQNRVKLV